MSPSGEVPADFTVVITEYPEGDDGECKIDSLPEHFAGKLFVEKYELISTLGQGGMGTVYKVRHVLLDKLAALKVLHSEHAMGDGVLRFQQEAKVVSSLKHPNIVGVMDFGIAADGQPYMVMDLLEGVPLNTLLKSELVSVERLAKIFGQVCDALSYAHEKAIVHRDIKPGNIMVHTQDGVDYVTVVDFGIAKILPQEDSSKMHLTKTGDVFGTPLYMSPEQCLGHPVDARADIYALGCVMYEAFARHHPFVTGNVFELVTKQISETPPPFNKPGMKASERRFEAIVLKAMAKRPEDRYRFAVEMASELKMVEAKESGFLSEMKVRVKVTQSRVRAGSKQAAWWAVGAQVLSVLAIVNSVALATIPHYLNKEVVQMQRYSEVLSTLMDSVSTSDDGQMMRPTPDVLLHNMRDIRSLVISDPDQKQAYRDLLRALPKAEKSLTKAERVVMEMAMQFDFATIKRELEPMMQKVISHWTDVGLTFAKLESISYAKCKAHKDAVQWYLQTYSVCKWTGVTFLCALFALLSVRVRSEIQRRKSAKGLPVK